MLNVAFYPTSHGFGHASRISALVNEFLKLGAECHIISDRPEFLFPKDYHVHLHKRSTDTGMFQTTWQTPDIEKTFSVLANLWQKKKKIVDKEVEFLLDNDIELVIVDIPFFPIIAANEVNIPVIGITNFDWHFNYREVIDLTPNKDDIKIILDEMYDIYQKLDYSIILPFSNSDSVKALPNQYKFGNLCKTINPNRESLCNRFNIAEDKIIALISFGGILSDLSNFETLISDENYVFLTNTKIGDYDNVRILPRDLNYSEIISSCDVVITKVGYSTLAECCAAGTYLCYSARNNFPEDKPLLAGLKRYSNSQRFYIHDNGIEINLPSIKPEKKIIKEYQSENYEICKFIYSKFYENKRKMKAIIDFGTNNSTMIVYENDDVQNIVLRSVKITGIGKGLEDNIISRKAILNSVDILVEQVNICNQLGVQDVRIIVTNIGRIAANFQDYIDEFKCYSSIKLEIISADEESLLGAKSSLKIMNEESFYNVDIGGSSTEISYISNGKIEFYHSFPFGIILFYNKYKKETKNIYFNIEQDIENFLRDIHFDTDKNDKLCGIGKLFQNLYLISEGYEQFINFSDLKIVEVESFIRKLDNQRILYPKFIDIDKKEIDYTILEISRAIVRVLLKIFKSRLLYINPLGIEGGV